MLAVPSTPTPPALDAAIIAVPSDDAVTQALQLVRGGGQVLLFAHTKRNKAAENRKQKFQPIPPVLNRFPISAFS